MAHRKAGGTAKNLRDSQPKYLGVKLADGQKAQAGSVIVRQPGTVKFGSKRKTSFNGSTSVKKVVNVI